MHPQNPRGYWIGWWCQFGISVRARSDRMSTFLYDRLMVVRVKLSVINVLEHALHTSGCGMQVRPRVLVVGWQCTAGERTSVTMMTVSCHCSRRISIVSQPTTTSRSPSARHRRLSPRSVGVPDGLPMSRRTRSTTPAYFLTGHCQVCSPSWFPSAHHTSFRNFVP